jgi:hypothetical protein
MNREPSPDRLTFQIASTTISPNYPEEELETLDREVLVISADVPPQGRETDEHNARMPTLIELLVSNKNSMQPPQPQVNTQTTPDKAMTTLGDKRPQLKKTTSTMKVIQASCMPQTS